MKKTFCLVFIFIILVTLLIPSYALNSGFETEEIFDEQKEKYIDNLNLKLVTEEPQKRSIVSFAVSGNELIALGYEMSGTEGNIAIYDKSGAFQYAYSFVSGGSFYLEWDELALNIYFVRGEIIYSVASDGTVLDVKSVKRTKENSDYINEIGIYSERYGISVGENRYFVRNDMGILDFFATSYSQLVCIDKDGNETVIYDVNSVQITKTMLAVTCILAFVSCVIVLGTRKLIRSINDCQSKNSSLSK